MKSGKQRRKEIESRRASRRESAAELELTGRLANGSAIPVDHQKIFSRSAIPTIPDFYFDREFTCRRCGREEVWTAKQQQWWYEEAKGAIESIAVECDKCRENERRQKAGIRRAHLEGLHRRSERWCRIVPK